jgi:hypothetical protein
MACSEYSNDALVNLFLSRLRTDNTAYYSTLHTTLENQHANGQKISFCGHGTQIYSTRGMTYIQRIESSSTGEFSNHHNGNPSQKVVRNLNVLKIKSGIQPMLAQQEEDMWQWQPKKFIMQPWPKYLNLR